MTIEERKKYLFELNNLENKLLIANFEGKYYNSLYPELSTRLIGLLSATFTDGDEWDSKYWADDIIITKINPIQDGLLIWGILIFGNNENDIQYVTPIHSIFLNGKIEFYFFDLNIPNLVTYESFNNDRDIFDRNFYSTNDWDIKERNWKFRTCI